MSETYLKPSQTSKMKLLAKVVNASRDVFRTAFSIQNAFRTSRMASRIFTPVCDLICCRIFVSQIMAHLKAYVEVNPTLTGPTLEK